MNRVLLALVLLVIATVGASEGAVRRLSEHRDAGSYPRLNDQGQVAWLAGGVAYLWDGQSVRALGEGIGLLGSPFGWPGSLKISNLGHVAWVLPRGDAWEIDLWDGTGLRRLTQGWPAARRYGWSMGSGGHVAWVGQVEHGNQLLFWNGLTVRPLNANVASIYPAPQVNEWGHVLWQAVEGQNQNIYLWDGTAVQKLGNGRGFLPYPFLSRTGAVIWDERDADNDQEIFLWDGTQTRQLTQNEVWDFVPRLNAAGQAVWLRGSPLPHSNAQVIYWDGITAFPLTEMGEAGSAAEISEAGSVVWAGRGLLSLWLFDGTRTRPLMEGLRDRLPGPFWVMSDTGHVAWRDADTDVGEIYLWNGVEVLRLTHNETAEGAPSVNNRGQVAWAGADGIYLYTPDGSGPPPVDPDALPGTPDPAPVTIAGIEASPAEILGGARALLRLRLTGEAPAGGMTVTLASSDPAAARVPESVTIPAGATEQELRVETSPVSAATTVLLAATYGETSRTVELRLVPASFADLAVSPDPVTGGNTASGLVRIAETPPAEGLRISLTSDQPAVASVPSEVLLEGDGAASFPVVTRPVRKATPVQIRAVYGEHVRTVTLLVSPIGLRKLAVSPARPRAGQTVRGIVTLTGRAPAGGVVVTLDGDPPLVVPATVTVPARATSASFLLTLPKPAPAAPWTLRASYGGTTRAVALPVRAR